MGSTTRLLFSAGLLASGALCAQAHPRVKSGAPSGNPPATAWSGAEQAQILHEVTLHLNNIDNLLGPVSATTPPEAAVMYLHEHLAPLSAPDPAARAGRDLVLEALVRPELLPALAKATERDQPPEEPGEASATAARLKETLERFGNSAQSLRLAAYAMQVGSGESGRDPGWLEARLNALFDARPAPAAPADETPPPAQFPPEDLARLGMGATHWGKVSPATQAGLLVEFFSRVRAAYPEVTKWRDLRAIHFEVITLPSLGKSLRGLYSHYLKHKDRPKGKDAITFMLERTGLLVPREKPQAVRTLGALQRRIRSGEFRSGILPWESMTPALQRQLIEELAQTVGKSPADLNSNDDFKTPIASIGQPLRGLLRMYELLLQKRGLAKAKTARWLMLETLGYIPSDSGGPLADLGSLRTPGELRRLLEQKALFDILWDELLDVNPDFLGRLVRELAAAKRLRAAAPDSPPSEAAVEAALPSVTDEELGALTREDYEGILLPGLGRTLIRLFNHFRDRKFKEHGTEAKPTTAYILETIGLTRSTRLVQEAFTLEAIRVTRTAKGLPKNFWKTLPNSARRESVNYLGQLLDPPRGPDALALENLQTEPLPALGGTLEGMLNYYIRDQSRPPGNVLEYILEAVGFIRSPQKLATEARRLGEAAANVPDREQALFARMSSGEAPPRSELDAAMLRARRASRRGRDAPLRKWIEGLESYWAILDTVEWTPGTFAGTVAAAVVEIEAKPPTPKRRSPSWDALQTLGLFFPDPIVSALETVLSGPNEWARGPLDRLRGSEAWTSFAHELRHNASPGRASGPVFSRRPEPGAIEAVPDFEPGRLSEPAAAGPELERRRRVLAWAQAEGGLQAQTYDGLREEIMTRFESVAQAAIRSAKVRSRNSPMVDEEDMASIGALAKRGALDRYDPDVNGDFRKFLYWQIVDAIRAEIKKAAPDSQRVIYVRGQLRARPELAAATAEAAAQALGVTVATVIAARRQATIPSLDAEAGEGGDWSLKQSLQGPGENPSEAAARGDLIKSLMGGLGDEERSLLILHFHNGLTSRQIAQELDRPQAEIEGELEALTNKLAAEAARRGITAD